MGVTQTGITIPLEYDGISHSIELDQENAKHQAALRWKSAVNNADKTTLWGFRVCKDVHTLEQQLTHWVKTSWD